MRTILQGLYNTTFKSYGKFRKASDEDKLTMIYRKGLFPSTLILYGMFNYLETSPNVNFMDRIMLFACAMPCAALWPLSIPLFYAPFRQEQILRNAAHNRKK